MVHISQFFLQGVLILLLAAVGQCAVEITSQPQDATVYVGETAQFNCNYTGTSDSPFWYIGGQEFYIETLPSRHSYRNRMLIVRNVQLSDSGTTYQCSFGNPVSRVATLTVLSPGATSTPPPMIAVTTKATTAIVITTEEETTQPAASFEEATNQNVDQTSAAASTSGVENTQELFINASLPDDDTTQSQEIVIACTSATVGVAMSLLLFLGAILKIKHRLKAAKSNKDTEPEYAEISNKVNQISDYTEDKSAKISYTTKVKESKDPLYEVIGDAIKMEENSAYGYHHTQNK